MGICWVQKLNVMENCRDGLQAWLDPGAQMVSSGIFLLSLSSLFLGVVLLSPLVIGVASNILFTTPDTRRKRERASLVVPSKFLGMVLVGQPASHAHWLGQRSGPMWLAVSPHRKIVCFWKKGCWGQGQQHGFQFIADYLFLDPLRTGRPRRRRTWDPS